MRARLGTAADFCEVDVIKLRTPATLRTAFVRTRNNVQDVNHIYQNAKARIWP
jgi:hypothetical protein